MEGEAHSGNKDGYHHPLLSSGSHTSESPNAKRKVESVFGLFCVLRKRARGDISVVDDGFDYAEKGDDFCCSDTETDLSECSEFDVISQHVVEDEGLIGSKSLSRCNSPDGGPSRNMLEACSVQQTVGCLSDYKADDDGEDEMSFSDIDAMICRLNLIPDDSDSCFDMEGDMSKHPRHTLLALEHCSMTSIPRGIISQGAIAVLHSRGSKHFIRKQEVIIGRSCDGMNVDIDLGKCGYGSNISRRQALVKLENNGSFSLKNLGKRHILVNGEKLSTGQIVSLTSCSSVDIRGEVFVFKINKKAVRQFLKNNNTRNRFLSVPFALLVSE